MPNIIQGNIDKLLELNTDVLSANYEYEYPDGLDLKPGSKLHKKLQGEILARARDGHAVIQKRIDLWNATDKTLTAYIRTDDSENDITELDDRKPVSIVFPYSFAIMETLLTYMVMAFLNDPIFRYEGQSPEDTVGAIMLEKVVNLHCVRTKVALAIHTMFRDNFGYGLCIGAPGWTEKRGRKTVKKKFSNLINMFSGERYEKGVEENALLFEGNELTNIDPYLYLPDPEVSAHDVQKGESTGWVSKESYNDLLSRERWDDDLFNVKYLRHIKGYRSQYAADQSEREKKWESSGNTRERGTLVRSGEKTHPVDVIYMYMKVVPKDLGLGDGEYPEKWLFGLANDSIIVKAQPLDLDHDMFPVVVGATDFDGYSSTPIARLEVLSGLQKTLDWLFNSHIANVRKAINDMLVVDPYLVNMKDLRDPKAGKLIRLRRPAWGRGVERAVEQLKVADITQANIADSSWIVQWMQKVAGADDPLMGSLRKGGPERLTKGEFQGTQAGAVSRLEKIARVFGLQVMQDLGYMFASHTQQLMSEELYVSTTGRWQETLAAEYGSKIKGNRMKVTPFDLLIDYDVKVRDGSVPGGNFAEAWLQMFNIIMTNQELGQMFEIPRIFKHIARNMGAKNVDDFVRTQTMPNEQIEIEAQKGNIAPLVGY